MTNYVSINENKKEAIALKKKLQRNLIKRRKHIAFKRRIKAKIMFLLFILSLVAILTYSINNMERFSPISKYQLMNGVENNNPSAIEIFNDYIERDIYLFDGPITIKAMAEKYDLDYHDLKKEYESSKYNNLQKFYDKVIEKRVK